MQRSQLFGTVSLQGAFRLWRVLCLSHSLCDCIAEGIARRPAGHQLESADCGVDGDFARQCGAGGASRHDVQLSAHVDDMLIGVTGSLIGGGAVYLGSKGFSRTSLPVWKKTSLIGRLARIVGGGLLIFGVLLMLFSIMRILCPCPAIPTVGGI